MQPSLTTYVIQVSFQQIGEANSFTICASAVLVYRLKMYAQKTYVLWLNRNAEEQAFSGRGAHAR
jgi:hypothetical protein